MTPRPWGVLALILVAHSVAAADQTPVVVLPPGDTVGPLVLDRPQVLRGSTGSRIVRRPGTTGPTVWVTSPGVTVEDLCVVGSGEGDRRSHTAVVVSAPGAVLKNVTVTDAWSGLWIDGADGVTVDGYSFTGPAEFPFWQRGDGVRVTKARGTSLKGLNLGYSADGVYVESSSNTVISRVAVHEARYGVHLMFARGGRVTGLQTRRAVVGLMVMESSDWKVADVDVAEGYRTGSAGIRLIKTSGLEIRSFRSARNAAGVELVDARNARFTDGWIEENAVAWAWSGDDSGTLVTGLTHRGNLVDLSASVPTRAEASGDHNHAKTAAVGPSTPSSVVGPRFDGNFWDSWKGWDRGDGRGDTPYRFDAAASGRLQARPWEGLFLGSPWSIVSASLPGGVDLDPRPLVHPRPRL